MNNKQLVVLVGACVISVALRFAEIPIWNVGSMAALSILCGAVIRHPAGILIPLAIRLLTDSLLHAKTGYGFFSSWPFDYSAYIVIFFLVGRNVTPSRASTVFGGSLASIAIYFLASNFGVWMMETYYPHTAAGLVQCLIAGIPFAKGTLIGNMLFAPAFFFAWNAATGTMSAAKSTGKTAALED